MKQYKLIKKYPASPELGYITEFNEMEEDWATPNMTLLDDCQDNPEFWEEIIKPFFVTENGVEVNEHTQVYWTCQLPNNNFYSYLYPLTICKNHITGSLYGTHNYKIFSTEEAAKDFCLKSKPLFISEDGISLFKDDICYAANKDDYSELQICNLCNQNKAKINGFLWFSTIEKAEEYILMNKPCLSLNDLLSVWGDTSLIEQPTRYYTDAPLFLNFKQLAKTKI